MAAWALLLIGSWATVTVLANKEMRPPNGQCGGWRLIYILLLLGCISSACSIYWSNRISSESVAYAMTEARLTKAKADKNKAYLAAKNKAHIAANEKIATNENMILPHFNKMENYYENQRTSFYFAAGCVIFWLLLYMLWWIWFQKTQRI